MQKISSAKSAQLRHIPSHQGAGDIADKGTGQKEYESQKVERRDSCSIVSSGHGMAIARRIHKSCGCPPEPCPHSNMVGEAHQALLAVSHYRKRESHVMHDMVLVLRWMLLHWLLCTWVIKINKRT